jgi:selenocysteine lyase/cysteine desulfurase
MIRTTCLEEYFSVFRKNIVGNSQLYEFPFGRKRIIYADWTASGRAYEPMENCIQNEILPFMANTHTDSTLTGKLMTRAYEKSKDIIKHHVNAAKDDMLVFCGSGMTGAVNKLQRMLGLCVPERLSDYGEIDYLTKDETLQPVVFVSRMEHHSNQISWLETIAIVEFIEQDRAGHIDLQHFRMLLEKYKDWKNKILAITACSNVTGIQTAYHRMAEMIHEYDGLCFVDFACSAPYVNIDMHPESVGASLDAIYFSPHKFLGGPGTAGVLIFGSKLYRNAKPDQPGGGTITYSNPWKVHKYVHHIEHREDGGTPPILQGIRVGMCIRLKEEMGIDNLLEREKELVDRVFERLSTIENIDILAGHIKKRLGVISFVIRNAHYNLIVKILNDRFGIQTRGGCSCAGTYGHILMQISKSRSYEILKRILSGDFSSKPGWIRLSVHPTMSNKELEFILDAIEQTSKQFSEWMNDYAYQSETNEFVLKNIKAEDYEEVNTWFNISDWNK